MIVDLNSLLNSAQKLFLLGGLKSFVQKFRMSEQIIANHKIFENEIRSFANVEITKWTERKIGGVKIAIPSEISFDETFLLMHRPHLKLMMANFDRARAHNSVINIDQYLKDNYALSCAHHETLFDAVQIANYILTNRESIQGLYLRQIPHGKSTKLLADHPIIKGLLKTKIDSANSDLGEDIFAFFGLRSKPSVFQFFSNEVRIAGAEFENFHGIINDYNFRNVEFKTSKIVIVENEEAYYPLTEAIKDATVILGSGLKAAGLRYFTEIMIKQVYYWGDIDKEGYEIMNSVASFIPQIRPLCMDFESIEKYRTLSQLKRSTKAKRILLNLSKEYELVCAEEMMIEQEQIPIDDVLAQF